MIMKHPSANKVYKLDEARERIRAYCVYRDRSHYEVAEKLREYGLIAEVADQLILELIQENYLSEERFARAFVRGKFNQKNWGRQKIRRALHIHQLSDYVLKKALSEIDEGEYLNTMEKLLQKKDRTLRESNAYIRKRKLAEYLIRKGYENELVWDLIRKPQD